MLCRKHQKRFILSSLCCQGFVLPVFVLPRFVLPGFCVARVCVTRVLWSVQGLVVMLYMSTSCCAGNIRKGSGQVVCVARVLGCQGFVLPGFVVNNLSTVQGLVVMLYVSTSWYFVGCNNVLVMHNRSIRSWLFLVALQSTVVAAEYSSVMQRSGQIAQVRVIHLFIIQ